MKNIFILSIGKIIRKHNNLYFITKDGQKKPIPMENIENIFVLNKVSFTYNAIKYIASRNILVHFFYENLDKGLFYYMGTFYPNQRTKAGELIVKQVRAYESIETRAKIALEIVDATRYNFIKVLEKHKDKDIKEELVELRNFNVKKEFESKLVDWKDAMNLIRGLEASVWQLAYRAVDKILKYYKIDIRTRRPPRNEANAIISFVNSLLYAITLSEIHKTHLEPTISFLHELREKRFSLAPDLAEPFKPLITFRILIETINQGMIKDKHFVKGLNGILLNEYGKRIIIERFNRKLEQTIKLKNKGRKSLKTLIRYQAYNLERAILDGRDFRAFRLVY